MRYFGIIITTIILAACSENNPGKDDTSTTTETTVVTNTPVIDTTTTELILSDTPEAEPITKPQMVTYQQATQQQLTVPNPDTFCYMMSEGENKENTNAIKLIIMPDGKTIAGELLYLAKGQPPAAGKLKGTVKDKIVTADWTFIKQDTLFYSVPVAFKMTDNAIYQKPSALDNEGTPYLPKDGEYSYKFNKVDCSKYPD